MQTSDREHILEIESALQGVATERDPQVIDSWRRCIDIHKLDPTQRQGACVVSETRLKEHRQEAEELIYIARGGLSTLFRQVAGQHYVVLLADPVGVTVDHFGDPRFERELQKAGLYMGARWLEEQSGTSAVGACIQLGEAITIHQSDHFGLTHTPLSCTAAPIYNTTGTLAAVLDISLLRSPRPKSSQRLAMQLVSASARRVELANLMARSVSQWVLRFSLSPELLDIDPEAAMTIDDSGHIVGFTHAAARTLATVSGMDWREPEKLLDQPLNRFFNLDINTLPRYLRGRPSEQRILQLIDGSLVFAHAIAPQPAIPQPTPISRLRRKDPLSALHGGDDACQILLKTAYRLVQSTVPVLIQGENGSDRQRLARALHDSRTPEQPFRVLDCVGLTPAMLNSGEWLGEIFGNTTHHTHSVLKPESDSVRPHAIKAALNGGTLFIKGLDDLYAEAQDALLRLLISLEQQQIDQHASVRTMPWLLCSTRQILTERIAQGQFRDDLFHRLAGATLVMPPLRERQDFDWLLERELRTCCQSDPPVYRFTSAARDTLRRHHWPGNLRELNHVINVAIAMSSSACIDVKHLPTLPPQHPSPSQLTAPANPRSPEQLKQLLDANGWNISGVARQLGVDRSTVHRRIRRAGLQRPDWQLVSTRYRLSRKT